MNKEKLQIEKEKELLAIIIENPESISDIFSKISIDMISKEHREVFKSIVNLQTNDSGSIVWELKKRNYESLKEVLELSKYIVPNTEKRIKEYFDITDSIKTDKILTETLKESKNNLLGLDMLNDLKKKIDSELEKYTRFEKPISFNDSLENIILRLQNRTVNGDSLKTTGFPSFNTATGGLNEGNLIGIAGAFKNGKTTFGLNILLDYAGQNIPSAILSLEMTKAEIEDKILAYKTGIPYEKIRNPQRLDEDEKLTIAHFYGNNRNFDEKIFLYDKSFTIKEIESVAKELIKQGVKIILIDYLGLIKSTSKNIENREREISQLSNSLKILAKETNTVIIVLSQLNRSGIKDASSINLAESIALARESDFLFTIYKPELSGYHNIQIDGRDIPIDKNSFMVKLDSSRHTQSGHQFLLSLTESGKMKEMQTQYDLEYLNKVSQPVQDII